MRNDSARELGYLSFDDLPIEARDRSLYGKLYMSSHDISIARQAARFIRKKGWHGPTFMRRGSTQIQQIAHTTTMIVAYSRPFKPGRGNGATFPEKLLRPYSAEEREMHVTLLRSRDKVHAHMDVDSYVIRPLDNEYIKSIDRLPYTHFSAEEIDQFLSMTDGLCDRIAARMEEIHASGRSSTGRS